MRMLKQNNERNLKPFVAKKKLFRFYPNAIQKENLNLKNF